MATAATPPPAAAAGSSSPWMAFFEKIQNDPNMQAALLDFGAQLSNAPGRNPVGETLNAFQGASQNFQNRKAIRARGDIDAQDRERKEETRKAELAATLSGTKSALGKEDRAAAGAGGERDLTKARTDKLAAETKQIAKGKSAVASKSTDFVRKAEAYAKIDPRFDGDVDKAIIFLQEQSNIKNEGDFVADYIVTNQLTSGGPAATAVEAADAWIAFQNAVKSKGVLDRVSSSVPTTAGTGFGVTEDMIRRAIPGVSEAFIQEIVNSPRAQAEFLEKFAP